MRHIDEKGLFELEQKASLGDPNAQFDLGMCYVCEMFSSNGSPDYEKAEEWWQKAAVQGNIEAQVHTERNTHVIFPCSVSRIGERGEVEALYTIDEYSERIRSKMNL